MYVHTYACGGGHYECESIWKSINIGFKLFDNNTDCLTLYTGEIKSLLCNLMLILCVCMPPTGSRVRVILNKSSSGLGFSLKGGVGSSSGDKPLTVQKIFRGKTTFS